MDHPISSVEFKANALAIFLATYFELLESQVYVDVRVFHPFKELFGEEFGSIRAKILEEFGPFTVNLNSPASDVPEELLAKLLSKKVGALYWFPRNQFDKIQFDWSPEYIRRLNIYGDEILKSDPLEKQVSEHIYSVDPIVNKSAIKSLENQSSRLLEAAMKIDEMTLEELDVEVGDKSEDVSIVDGLDTNSVIPASDRRVTLNHNSPAVQEMELSIDDVILEIENDRTNDLDADTLVAIVEIKAGRELLKGPEVDPIKVQATIVVGLQLLAQKAISVAIDKKIEIALGVIAAFFKFGIT